MSSETTPPGEANTTTPLSADQLGKTFRQGANLVQALNGVSLSIQQGEFTAIMGPSGCGKSTLLHVMAGLTHPDSGAVWVEGEKLSSMSDARLTDFRRRRIGLVFQQFNLVAALTALENVMLPLMAEGGRASVDAQAKAKQLLERLGIGDRAGHRPDAMSGGEQQRVAIARALVTDPAIILADEPTGSLDSANGHAICSLLNQLHQEEGRSIVMVTHEPAVAAWAGRVVVMKDGVICSDFGADQFPDAQSLSIRYQEIVSGQSTVGAV